MSAADYEKFSNETGYRVKPRKNQSFQELAAANSYTRLLNAKSYAAHKKVSVREACFHMSIELPGSRIADFIEAYEAFKEREGKYDFDDMLLSCLGEGSLGTEIILVDECQDLSDLQLDIIREWSVGAEQLYLAGDDDQAIYSFSGASQYGFLDFPSDDTRVLRKSYRVPVAIGNRAQRIVNKLSKRKSKSVEWSLHEGSVQRTPTWRHLNWREAYENERNVMVLARHRRMVDQIRESLNKLGIICSVDGKLPWKESTIENVKNFLTLEDGGSLEAGAMEKLIGAMGRKNERRDFRKKISKRKKFFLRDMAPVTHWWKEIKGADAFMRKMIRNYGVETLDKPVTIDVSTFHASKGREADAVVVLTDCYEKVMETQRKAPDSERRLCYVACTRARQKLIICNPETDKYLLDLVKA